MNNGQNPTDNAFVGFIRAAHVIKGAASNLMCEQLRKTAMELETIATNANAQSAATKKKKENKEKAMELENVMELETIAANAKAAPRTSAPAPIQKSSEGGMFSGIGSTIAQGMSFGTGSAIAHQAVDGSTIAQGISSGTDSAIAHQAVGAIVVEESIDLQVFETVKKKLDNLKVAVRNYHKYLEDMDV